MIKPKRTHIRPEALIVGGIPKQFINTQLEDFKTYGDKNLQEVKQYIKKYLHKIDEQRSLSSYNGICFYGSNGTGKTMLSSIILKQAYINRFTFKRITFLNYLKAYTATWNNSYNTESEDETLTKAIQFLVLEEIGKEIDTKINVSVLEDLLRYREDNSLPTIICTNLSPNDLFDRYGSSVASLLKGNVVPIKIADKDRRHI